MAVLISASIIVLSTSFTTHTSTTLLNGSKHAVLCQLHDHDLMISLNPLVQDHRLLRSMENPDSPYPTNTWEIVDRIDGLGTWTRRFSPDTVTYHADMTNTQDGMRSIVKAPMGIISHITWKVSYNKNGETVLEETGEVRCNKLVGGLVKGAIEDSHQQLVERFLERLDSVMKTTEAVES